MNIKLYPDVPQQRTSRILRDLVIVVVLAGLGWMGHQVYEQVDSIRVLATGVTSAGESVQGGFGSVADAVDGLPLVGDELAEALTSSGDATGGNVATLGAEGAQAIHRAAQFTGWLTFLVPATLLLALTLPARIRSIRKLNEAQRFLVDDGDSERQRLMAMRAAFGLPVDILLEYSADPIGDLMAGNHQPLLDALYAEAGLVRQTSTA